MADTDIDPIAVPVGRIDSASAPVESFSLWSAFALAFSDISPIVGIYSVFALGLATAGPAFWWAFPVVLLGQLAVAGVFGDLVSKWPLQGSVYAWARQLLGVRAGWFTNWIYSWGLTIAVSVLALSAAQFFAPAVGLDDLSPTQISLLALAFLAFGTAANVLGDRYLKILLYLSMACELIASAGIGIALLFFHRVHSFSILFDGRGTGHGVGYLWSPLLIVVAIVGFSFVGFESAGAIAEEVKEARRALPRAMVLSLAAVGGLVMFAALGLLLAVPNLGDVMSGKDADPITTTLETHLGATTGRILLIALTIGFTASLIAVQAAVSRSLWASARARELPASRFLGQLKGRDRLPMNTILLVAVVAAVLVFIHNPNVYSLLLSAATTGFVVSYLIPIVGAAVQRARGRWTPGPVHRRHSGILTYVAAVWIILEAVNIAWPRDLYGVWYLNWGIVLAVVVLVVVGAVVSAVVLRDHVAEEPAQRGPAL
jgi:amino acid transporter